MTDPQQPQSRRAARDASSSRSRGSSSRPRSSSKPRSSSGADVATDAPAQRSRLPLLITAGVLAFALLGTGAVFAGAAVGARSATPVVGGDGPAPEPARAVPDQQVDPVALRTCSVTKVVSNKKLDRLFLSVLNAETGEVLYDRDGEAAQRTASTLKILTAAAAISVLGPDYRIATRVLASNTPGTVVLVGGGDPTLSALPVGQKSIYGDAPKLATLASKTIAAFEAANPGQPITNVVLDATYWSDGDKWDPSWNRSEQKIGYQSEVTALQVDGDRKDPRALTSPRSTDPIGRAGAAFVAALGIPGVTVSVGAAENGAPELASVKSAPVSTLVRQMLLTSDNTVAEMLARITSRESGSDGTASSLATVIPNALKKFGVEVPEVFIVDGSGLSENNAVPAQFMAQFLAAVAEKKNGLGTVYDGLSIAGQSGSLAGRFTGNSAVAVGKVRAKTGWIDSSYSLAGIVSAKDGTRLTFAAYAIRDGISADAKAALDSLAARLYTCGNNMSKV